MEEELPFLRQFDTKIITNIAGHSIDEYCEAVQMLNGCPEIAMFEVNISCPNVSEGGIAFGTDPAMAEKVTAEVKKVSKNPVMIKLTPNVTDITEIARAAEAGGADAVSLINTLLGMRIDLKKRRAVLARKVGGFSGPADGVADGKCRKYSSAGNGGDLHRYRRCGVSGRRRLCGFHRYGCSVRSFGSGAH